LKWLWVDIDYFFYFEGLFCNAGAPDIPYGDVWMSAFMKNA
jgi:hypothetical protein